ncbi:hypothetical protein ABK040_006437 [Willaertia magna]
MQNNNWLKKEEALLKSECLFWKVIEKVDLNNNTPLEYNNNDNNITVNNCFYKVKNSSNECINVIFQKKGDGQPTAMSLNEGQVIFISKPIFYPFNYCNDNELLLLFIYSDRNPIKIVPEESSAYLLFEEELMNEEELLQSTTTTTGKRNERENDEINGYFNNEDYRCNENRKKIKQEELIEQEEEERLEITQLNNSFLFSSDDEASILLDESQPLSSIKCYNNNFDDGSEITNNGELLLNNNNTNSLLNNNSCNNIQFTDISIVTKEMDDFDKTILEIENSLSMLSSDFEIKKIQEAMSDLERHSIQNQIEILSQFHQIVEGIEINNRMIVQVNDNVDNNEEKVLSSRNNRNNRMSKLRKKIEGILCKKINSISL